MEKRRIEEIRGSAAKAEGWIGKGIEMAGRWIPAKNSSGLDKEETRRKTCGITGESVDRVENGRNKHAQRCSS